MLTALLAASLSQTALPDSTAVAPAAPVVQDSAAPAAAAPVAATDAHPVVPPPAETPAPAPAPPAAPASSTSTPNPGSGQIVVTGEHQIRRIDPLEGANKVSFEVLESVDKKLVDPIMKGYRKDIPGPIRQGLHNFFFNLTEPVNALNYVLQLHPGKAFKTVERFGINSTIGVGGLVDVAKRKPLHIYYRPNGFANTMGYWGIGPGPYMFLPLIGATSLRDLIGALMDQAALPTVVGKPFNNYYYVVSAGTITELDYRLDIDAGVERVRKTGNPYVSYRQAYFKSRFEEIEALHGRGPLAKGELGQPPFVRPLFPDDIAPVPAPVAPPAATSSAPAEPVTPPAAVPAPPPPPVFISQPVIQPIPAGN